MGVTIGSKPRSRLHYLPIVKRLFNVELFQKLFFKQSPELKLLWSLIRNRAAFIRSSSQINLFALEN
jgi:hypothetical protein